MIVCNTSLSCLDWQFPFAKNTQDYQALISLDRLYTNTSVIYETTNTVISIKATLASLFFDILFWNILWRLKYILTHYKSILGLFCAISLLVFYFSSTTLRSTLGNMCVWQLVSVCLSDSHCPTAFLSTPAKSKKFVTCLIRR